MYVCIFSFSAYVLPSLHFLNCYYLLNDINFLVFFCLLCICFYLISTYPFTYFITGLQLIIKYINDKIIIIIIIVIFGIITQAFRLARRLLYVSNVTSQNRTTISSVNQSLLTYATITQHMIYRLTLLIYFHTKFHLPISGGPLITAIVKMKAKREFWAATILLFYIQQIELT